MKRLLRHPRNTVLHRLFTYALGSNISSRGSLNTGGNAHRLAAYCARRLIIREKVLSTKFKHACDERKTRREFWW